MIPLHVIKLQNHPIYSQLQLEEALLRADKRNWLILNQGSTPAIVMGISAKKEQVIDWDHYSQNPVPIIRRFSGGGTVYVDHNTLFVTFIWNKDHVNVPPYPQPILQWSADLYKTSLAHPEFFLKENDYTLGNRKIGGNAQYIQRDRWLHHSSLLWDYCSEKIQILKMPPKMPYYRQKRPHNAFLSTLKKHFSSKDDIINKLLQTLALQFQLIPFPNASIEEILLRPHRKTTQNQ